jgi:hypothetical protein
VGGAVLIEEFLTIRCIAPISAEWGSGEQGSVPFASGERLTDVNTFALAVFLNARIHFFAHGRYRGSRCEAINCVVFTRCEILCRYDNPSFKLLDCVVGHADDSDDQYGIR